MNFLILWMLILFSCQFLNNFCNCLNFSNNVSNMLRNFQGRNVECGGIGRFKRLQMQNPPQLQDECVYKISPISRFVCQIRIDFDIILQPPVDKDGNPGPCGFDIFSVGDIKLCGVNRNQHIYVPFNITRFNQRDTLKLNFTIANRFKNPNLGFVSWNIRLTQLECPNGAPRMVHEQDRTLMEPINPRMMLSIKNDGWLIAPTGCLQYYSNPEGIVESFNYNDGIGPYLSNFSYAICFRRRETDKELRLFMRNFLMDSLKAEGDSYGENCLAKEVNRNDKEDYVSIAHAIVDEKIRTNIFCGITPQGKTIISKMDGPFVINFHSDNNITATHKKRGGFRIEYKTQGY